LTIFLGDRNLPGFRAVSNGVSELDAELGLQILNIKQSVVIDWMRFIVIDKANNDAVMDLDRSQLFDMIASRVPNFITFVATTVNKYYS